MFPNLASQIRTAFSNIVSNTLLKLIDDELMTLNTSAVAFCS